MTVSVDDVIALEVLEEKIKAILPASYTENYEDVLPVPMGSAPLRFDIEGKVAWNEIWGSFCDLAMAGGPPHRGILLEPATIEELSADLAAYRRNAAEIARALTLVTGLQAGEDAASGWVPLHCPTMGMAGWLTRAIVMENVLARQEQDVLCLPCGPGFRLHKEIRNVVTAAAKTVHYWTGHMPPEQQASIAALFRQTNPKFELLQPSSFIETRRDPETYRKVVERIAHDIGENPRLPCFSHRYAGWIGVECQNVRTAIWIMRAMVAEDVLARREGEAVFLPVCSGDWTSHRHDRLIQTFRKVVHLSVVKKLNPG
jgi:sirohydrochlorin cobaltochelatase